MSRPLLKSSQDAVARAAIPRLFVLELNAGRIHSMNTDGSGRETIVSDCHLPDGIVVDVEAGHIYWTKYGHPEPERRLGRAGRYRRKEPQGYRSCRSNRIFVTRQVKELDSAASTRNRNGTGFDMRSLFSLATFAIGALCFVAFLTKVRPAFIIVAPSPSEQVRVQ
jgi:hypothetical protein